MELHQILNPVIKHKVKLTANTIQLLKKVVSLMFNIQLDLNLMKKQSNTKLCRISLLLGEELARIIFTSSNMCLTGCNISMLQLYIIL